jgi:hypothetical protein
MGPIFHQDRQQVPRRRQQVPRRLATEISLFSLRCMMVDMDIYGHIQVHGPFSATMGSPQCPYMSILINILV